QDRGKGQEEDGPDGPPVQEDSGGPGSSQRGESDSSPSLSLEGPEGGPVNQGKDESTTPQAESHSSPASEQEAAQNVASTPVSPARSSNPARDEGSGTEAQPSRGAPGTPQGIVSVAAREEAASPSGRANGSGASRGVTPPAADLREAE